MQACSDSYGFAHSMPKMGSRRAREMSMKRKKRRRKEKEGEGWEKRTEKRK